MRPQVAAIADAPTDRSVVFLGGAAPIDVKCSPQWSDSGAAPTPNSAMHPRRVDRDALDPSKEPEWERPIC